MQPIHRVLCAILALALLSLPGLARGGMLFVTDRDYAPYSMVVNGRAAGIDVDVLTEAANRAGLELTFDPQPLKTMLEMLEEGKCDGAAPLFKTPERQRIAMFMEGVPVHYGDYVLFTKTGKRFAFNSYLDLTGRVIGCIAGVELGGDFGEAEKQGLIEVRKYPTHATAVQGLLEDEIDAFAGNIDVTYNRLKVMGMTSAIVYLPKKIVEAKPSYAVLSRSSGLENRDMVVMELERALRRMHQDGTYGRIARRYLIRF